MLNDVLCLLYFAFGIVVVSPSKTSGSWVLILSTTFFFLFVNSILLHMFSGYTIVCDETLEFKFAIRVLCE